VDDLNQESTKVTLQQLLATTADEPFYPPNAVWINCRSVTYTPHSNECGPRVLLALTIMSLHPNPSENMLLPYMHNNIAQICRTWIAASLLNGKVPLPEWLNNVANLSSHSTPSYLFSWEPNTTLNRSTRPNNSKTTQKGILTNNRQTDLHHPETARHIRSYRHTPTTHHNQRDKVQEEPLSETINMSSKKPRQIQKTLFDMQFYTPSLEGTNMEVWGHHPTEIHDQDTLRILFSNPRGLKLSTDILETQFSLGRAHSLHTGVLCLAETNINWGHPRALSKFHDMIRKVWKHSSTSKSYTKDDFFSEQQPGSTITMACDHWNSRVIEKGVDPFGLGRWSYIVLRGKDNHKILIITAYRVCRQTIQSVGVKTSTAQQYRQLSRTFRDADLTEDPIPRHQFIVDLQAWIEYKIENGHQIILSIDANEPFHGSEGSFTRLHYTLDKPIPLKGHDGTIATLVKSCSLCDPLVHHQPDQPAPSTYDRGKDRIDFIFTSITLLPSIQRSGIL